MKTGEHSTKGEAIACDIGGDVVIVSVQGSGSWLVGGNGMGYDIHDLFKVGYHMVYMITRGDGFYAILRKDSAAQTPEQRQ